MQPCIRLARATVEIDEVVLLEPTSLEVAAGEAIAVRGENGAGTTTLLRLCAGSLRRWCARSSSA